MIALSLGAAAVVAAYLLGQRSRAAADAELARSEAARQRADLAGARKPVRRSAR